MEPIQHEGEGAARSPEIPSRHPRNNKEGAGKPEVGPKKFHSDRRQLGGGPPCVGPPSDEGGMGLDARVVP